MHNWLNILTLLAPGVEHNVPPVQKWQDSVYLGTGRLPVNIFKVISLSIYMTVISAPFIGPYYARLTSDPPGKSLDRHILPNFDAFWHFWPTYSENKYPIDPRF